MLFKDSRTEGEWTLIHPELRAVLERLDAWSATKGIHPVLITQLVRTKDEQREIYTKYWLGLIAKLQEGQPLTPKERDIACERRGLSLEELAKQAEEKTTWHAWGTAADIRDFHYTLEQRKAVFSYLETQCARPLWELIEHDVTGPHIHVGRRDFSWRRNWAPPSPPPDSSPPAA